MKFKVVMSGRNCFDFLPRSLASVAAQSGDFDVCVVDDGSTDQRQPEFVQQFCEERGWDYLLKPIRTGPMHSQVQAIQRLNPQDDDVIVWVDADDRLAPVNVFDTLSKYYAEGALMTYGSYRSSPHSSTCIQGEPYPDECVEANDYRNARIWGFRFNHLRTVSWQIFQHLTDADFMMNGQYMTAVCDAAVMVPSLELCGGRYAFIPDQLYIYSSDNMESEWRKTPKLVNQYHGYIMNMPRKKPLEIS